MQHYKVGKYTTEESMNGFKERMLKDAQGQKFKRTTIFNSVIKDVFMKKSRTKMGADMGTNDTHEDDQATQIN